MTNRIILSWAFVNRYSSLDISHIPVFPVVNVRSWLLRRKVPLPAQPFWFLLTWTCILWYAYLVVYVGWKGYQDIRRMISDLKRRNES